MKRNAMIDHFASIGGIVGNPKGAGCVGATGAPLAGTVTGTGAGHVI